MSIVDPNQSEPEQIARQQKIIQALMRRANRQNEVGLSAYSAFQSAIELQTQVAEKTRDLEIAASELEILRFDQKQTRANLDHALAAMEGGFALFTDARLEICNELFRNLFPDIANRIETGIGLEQYFRHVMESGWLISADQPIHELAVGWSRGEVGVSVVSSVIELKEDRWYQMNVQRTGTSNVVVLLTEITSVVRQSRSEKETLIDAQAAYLQAMFENITSGVCTFTPSGEVMMFNGPFRELLGVPFTLLQKGTSFAHLVGFVRRHSLMSEEALAALEDWRAEPDEAVVLRSRAVQGVHRVLDLQAHTLPDGGFLIELKDVTLETRATETLENRVSERTAELTRANTQLRKQYEEQARVENELRLAMERAEAAVSSKTRFLAAASHDLLQPINAAKLMIATLLETSADTPFNSSVTRLQRAFTSTEQLLHSLLDISRLEGAAEDTITPGEVWLGGLMQGIIEDQSAVAEQKGVELRVVPSNAFVRSDPVYLLRSLQNLVVNAIQYNEPGGRVLVGTRQKGDKILLQVWDNGIGISPDDQERIFEEFARVDDVSVGSGVGLGLSVVERACRLLDHKLRVRSQPGVGSMFSIEMDRIERAQFVPETTNMPQPGSDQMKGLIAMVIENDEDVLYATATLLEQWGADVLAVTSTEEALRHVSDMGMPPDIILADYHLNGTDTGVQAICAIRKQAGMRVPAIVITANRSDSLLKEGRDIGFSVMPKPVQVSRLRPLIEWKVRWQSPATEVEARGPRGGRA